MSTAGRDDATTMSETSDTNEKKKSITVLGGLNDMVESLSSSLEGVHTNDERKIRISAVIGKLKALDKAMVTLKTSPTLESINLMSDMDNLAMNSLPEDTRKVLQEAESGSDVAMELVRRNLTQLPTLAKMLFKATPGALEADEGLSSLHTELASSLELYGALVAQGVNPRKRSWAQRLTEEISSLTELKWVSWRRLMHIVGMGVGLGLEDTFGDESSEVHRSFSREILWVFRDLTVLTR